MEEEEGQHPARVAPELSLDTWWYYKAAHPHRPKLVGTGRRRAPAAFDQAQSMNLYITNDYNMRQVLALYLDAWRSDVRRSTTSAASPAEVEDCENCASWEEQYHGRTEEKATFNPEGDIDVRLRHMIDSSATNLNDFNNMKYPWVSDWYRRTADNFWIPEEINLAGCEGLSRLLSARRTTCDKI